jgi:hypothetical protein
MTIIKKIVEIPKDGKIKLELQLPESFPIGKAVMKLAISPAHSVGINHEVDPDLIIAPAKQLQPGETRFQGLAGSLKNSKTFDGDPVEIVRTMRNEW